MCLFCPVKNHSFELSAMSGIVSSHYDFANSAKGTSNSKGGKGALIGTHSQQTTSRKAFQREHQEKDKGRVPMGVGREEPAVEKGRVPEQGRVPPLGWARASRVPRMQTKP